MVKTLHNITKHELIGLKVKIAEAGNETLIGKEGTIVDETKNTLTIQEKAGIKKILKKGTRFRLEIEGKTLDIEGETLVGRPEERIKK